MSGVDYCSVVFAGAPKAITDKLQRVLNTAARVVTGFRFRPCQTDELTELLWTLTLAGERQAFFSSRSLFLSIVRHGLTLSRRNDHSHYGTKRSQWTANVVTVG